MARYVVTAPCVITPVSYQLPGRSHVRGQVLELTAAEYTALGGASVLRAVAAGGTGASVTRDQLGTPYAASNSTP
jgi:hypothetical protein